MRSKIVEFVVKDGTRFAGSTPLSMGCWTDPSWILQVSSAGQRCRSKLEKTDLQGHLKIRRFRAGLLQGSDISWSARMRHVLLDFCSLFQCTQPSSFFVVFLFWFHIPHLCCSSFIPLFVFNLSFVQGLNLLTSVLCMFSFWLLNLWKTPSNWINNEICMLNLNKFQYAWSCSGCRIHTFKSIQSFISSTTKSELSGNIANYITFFQFLVWLLHPIVYLKDFSGIFKLLVYLLIF